MKEILDRAHARRDNGDGGFTLIELLVVVVIIGVLVAIAVPVYMNYRKGAANKSAESDVRGAVSAVEQFYTENGNAYPDTAASAEGANLSLAAKNSGTGGTIAVSPGNKVYVKNNTASYVICAQNNDGQKIYVYNSASGGSVKSAANLTGCS
ncbi:type II secretion system protein [Spirillospora albida]|uniref:type II secretion system protein n=1 Tax=Spirillospora albida TaxID=58123 RepID=UPI0004C1DE05|nr:prepilin-type N-terminal cleavage/methylation domain-containing protein [Spirillospora albida]